MEKFTANEKYHILICVKYARHELTIKLLKSEIEYEGYTHCNTELEQEMNQTRESITFYDALIDKLERLL